MGENNSKSSGANTERSKRGGGKGSRKASVKKPKLIPRKSIYRSRVLIIVATFLRNFIPAGYTDG